jgi:hypothetical protein
MSGPERKIVNLAIHKKQIEQEEEEEEEEEEKPQVLKSTQSTFSILCSVIVILCCFGVCLMLTFVLTLKYSKTIEERIRKALGYPDINEINWPLYITGEKNTISEYVSFNNTSQKELWEINQALVYRYVEEPGKYACLCMHHLDHPKKYNKMRICSIYNDFTKQYYFMRNPRLIGHSKTGTTFFKIKERSITCTDGNYTEKTRASNIFVEWEDEKQITQYCMFRDETALCLQMAVEEFEGKDKICKPQ